VSKNTCQYWVNEPVVCKYWDDEKQVCVYTPKSASDADAATRAPYCNGIGTDVSCDQYSGDGSTEYRCILPDISRQVGNRSVSGGGKWTRDQINGYNNGKCDGNGTDATCSGYSPYHMGFSSIEPDKYPYAADLTQFDTVPSGFVFRLPLYYDVSYVRAQLSRCYWWRDEVAEFSIDGDTGRINNVPTQCLNRNDVKVQEYWDTHSYDKDIGMWKAPCNGAKPECPGYTGICWLYCIDDKMRQGDKVLAEQILELRYYLFKENWDTDKYKESFADPEVQAWAGSIHYARDTDTTNQFQVNWIIDAWRVYLPDFEYFHINREKLPLTAGTSSNNYEGEYPDLVKELKSIPLKPIIRNKFETLEFPDGEYNIFESSNINHDEIVILGDTFWYNSKVYAINLSDPDLSFLPKNELLNYNSLFEMEQSWKNIPGKFESFYDKLSNDLDFVLKAFPEKAPTSVLDSHLNMFYIKARTFWGDNDIIVVDKGSGSWEYDHIHFRKLFIGGVIGQTSFKIDGSGTTDYLPSYQDDFAAYTNDNGEITFSFFPMVSEWSGDSCSMAYLYNDAVRKRLPNNPFVTQLSDTYIVGYKLYKILFGNEMELSIPNGNLRVLGNAGYILVILPDEYKDLSNAVRQWEIDGGLYLYYSENDRIEMEIYEKGTDGLEVNQFVIKPKNINEFRSVCHDTYLYIDKLYIYEKHSFGEVPERTYYGVEVVPDLYVTVSGSNPDSVIYHDDVMELQNDSYDYVLRKFGYDPLVISVVLKGRTGRVRGQIKTKLLTWVRQPYCRDVEIFYSWTGSYRKYTLLPEYNCYGRPGIEYETDENGAPISINNTYIPPCGDHDLSFFSETGPMWYPYDACDNYARYNIVGNLTEFDINIMEPFSDEADPPHGKWDIRMLGPADHFGYTCDSHAQLWNCLCDWSFCNEDKLGENRFSGYGYYRGGLDLVAKERALRNDGSLPKFGNVCRDFLRSYRSIDNIDYYVVNDVDSSFVRKNKWVPANEFYTVSSISSTTQNYPYLLYCSSDYYDDGSFFINPFGLYLVDNDLENISINEKIKVDASSNLPIRYRFSDIFNTHSSLVGIYYPYPKNPYQTMVGGTLVDIITWYTYKDCPWGDNTKSIQWAWQESWKDIDRYKVIYDNQLVINYFGDHPILSNENIYFDEYVNSNYEEVNGIVKGRHLFLNIEYPEYKYDFKLTEHRLVCDEGDSVISILAPTKSSPGVFTGNYWQIQLNNGPVRCFDSDGNWINTVSGCNKTLYDTCTSPPWVNGVTLFDTGYTDYVPSSDRTIQTYDSAGDPVYEYYQRGLKITIDNTKLDLIPSKMVLLNSANYLVRCDTVPDCLQNNSGTPWEGITTSEWYPNTTGYYYYVEYYCGDADTDRKINIDFAFQDGNGESQQRVISGVVIEFKYGADAEDDIAIQVKDTEYFGNLYHLPGLKMYSSMDGSNWTEIYSLDTMYLSNKLDNYGTKTGFYDLDIDATEYLNGYSYFRISFRISPTSHEISSKSNLSFYYDLISTTNIVGINGIKLYFGDLIDAVEDITTYERKYNISYGSHGDFPPHGYESTGSLLYPIVADRSTVYQYDTIGGVVGMPNSNGEVSSINKVRGRLMKKCVADKSRLEIGGGGSNAWLYKAEAEQKKIHDEIAIVAGNTTFTLTSVAPPGLEDVLNEIGLSFPTWSCNFINTLVRPLSPVLERELYSPCGHSFDRDFEHAHLEYACGRHGYPFYRASEIVYDYVFRHYCGDYEQDMIDAIVAYYRGVGNLLINPFLFTRADAARANKFSSHYKDYRSQGGNSILSLPPAVDPIN